MNKAVPWSIKGIDFDAREAAKEAARRDGLSLGEWMNRAIADRAAEIGADADGFDADERLEAVAAQLARLSGELDARSPPQRRRGETGRTPGPETLREPLQQPVPDPWPAARPQDEDRVRGVMRVSAPRPQSSAPPRPRLAGARDNAAAEALLEQAVAAFQQQAGRVEAGAARAMANVATLLESAQNLRADALAQVDARLAEIEQKLLRGGDDGFKSGFKPLQEMVASVQHRLAEIETRLPKSAPVEERRSALDQNAAAPEDSALRQIDSRLAALLARLEKSEAGQRETLQEKPFAGLEQRFDALLARLDHPVARHPAAQSAPASLRRGLLHSAISEIAARQRDLDAPSAVLPTTRALQEDARIDRLQQGVEVLSGRVDSMRREFSAVASSAEIEVLARQVDAMSRALEDVAPRSRMESLENAVLTLGERIERSRHEGMREGVLAPIEALAGELRRAVAEAGASANLDGVARQLHDVEDKIEHLRLAGGADRADFLKIRDQSEQLRAAIAVAVEQLQPLRRIEQQVAGLSEQLEQVAHLARDAGKAQQEGLAQGAAGWRGVEAKLDDLAGRIERVAGERGGGSEGEDQRFDNLSRRLDFVHQALASRIDEAREEARVKAPPTPPSLEPLLRALAEKLDAAVAPQADGRALEALERQVAQVSERLDSGDPQIGARLERAIEDLAQRFESTREAERDAARQAFRETLAEWQFPARDEEASREIADLREKQNASERRAQQTLSAVHETLEKVVDRLAMLEEDVIESRGGDALRVAEETGEAPATRPLARSCDFDDEDFLREPGAGRPGARRDDDEKQAAEDEAAAGRGRISPDTTIHSARTNYIDVARRAIAARAAAEKAEAEARAPSAADLGSDLLGERATYMRPRASGEAAGGRRLPALLLTAVTVLALGAVQAFRMFDTAPPPMQSVTEPGASSAPSPEIGSAAPELPAPAPAPAASAPAVSPASPEDAPAPNPAAGAAKQGAGASQIDPLAVATIPPHGNPLETVPAVAQVAIVRQMADKGDAIAQFDLAVRLIEGRGIGRDPAAAIPWFEKAAAQGLALAQFRLGAIYEKGAGTPRDAMKARDFYEKAAVQGNIRAMHNLAVLDAEGVEGKPDYAAAAQWFRRAAEFGVRDSQFNLAILYARGMGVSLDLAQSYVWFAIAAQQGDEDAAKKRDEIGARLDARTLEAAKKQVADFHAQTPAASSNDPPAAPIRPTALFTAPATRAATWARF